MELNFREKIWCQLFKIKFFREKVFYKLDRYKKKLQTLEFQIQEKIHLNYFGISFLKINRIHIL